MKLKRLLALLMAVVMLFSLAACADNTVSDDDDDDKEKKPEGVEGLWQCAWTFEMDEDGPESLQGYGLSFTVYMEIEFEDDTFELTCNKKKTERSVEAYFEDVVDIAWDQMIEAAGSEEAVIEKLGMDKDEYFEENFGEERIEEMMKSFDEKKEGTYELDGEELTLISGDDEKKLEGIWDGDTITIEREFQDKEVELVFERA